MLDLALRDLTSHKLRSFLTVLGVIIAIAAIVSLGSFTAGINELVQGQAEMVSGKILLTQEGASTMQGPPSGEITTDDLDEIRQMDGVDAVAGLFLKQSGQRMLVGVDFDNMELLEMDEIKMEEGDWPEAGDYKIAVGHTVSETSNLGIGDTVKFEDTELEVSGIVEELGTFIDLGMITSLEIAQEAFDAKDVVTMAYVKPNDISDVESIVEDIEEEFSTINAGTVEEEIEKAQEGIRQIQLITLSIGFITSLVAAIGIINTMFMSITEKTKQIGIMKAVGASHRDIIMDVLQQALLMSFFGGFVGVMIGLIGTAGVNAAMGMPLARVTWSLALYSFSYGVVLTLGSALYPAIKASKIDPIKAIQGGA
ncbi:MAG: ABC transporter permease [archaeon]